MQPIEDLDIQTCNGIHDYDGLCFRNVYILDMYGICMWCVVLCMCVFLFFLSILSHSPTLFRSAFSSLLRLVVAAAAAIANLFNIDTDTAAAVVVFFLH